MHFFLLPFPNASETDSNTRETEETLKQARETIESAFMSRTSGPSHNPRIEPWNHSVDSVGTILTGRESVEPELRTFSTISFSPGVAWIR